ncbi:MAG: FtsX-like permease family protein [Verrucomicrobiota bacterium]
MSRHSLHGSLRPFPILRLAVADLRDEWLLSLCISLAIAAVLAPLMILFGLKSGAVEILRHRLVQDPRNREIRPKITRIYDVAWFADIKRRPDVAFVTPLTRGISSTVEAVNVATGAAAKLDLSPTGRADALVTENGSAVPKENECVLTAASAEELNVQKGDMVEIRTNRRVNREFQSASLQLKVAGVLDLRAGGGKIAYVLLPVVEAVEQYLDGQSVPEYGWAGTRPLAHPEFDGALLVAGPEGLDPAYERKAVTDTGFVHLEKLDLSKVENVAGFKVDAGVWLLRPAGSTVRNENFDALKEKLRGSGIQIVPWVDSIPVKIHAADGRVFPASVKSIPVAVDETASLTPVIQPPDADQRGTPVIFPGKGKPAGKGDSIVLAGLGGDLAVPVVGVSGTPAEGPVLMPPDKAGILRQAISRQVERDPKTGEFIVVRRGYSGFRLFAKSIDQVDDLRRFLESKEIPVFHEGERINDVRTLDSQLSRFFWFIAGVGIAGAVATLAASLYASAERKSYELAVLRLLGLRRREIVQFPAWQGVLLTAIGFAMAVGIYAVASAVLGHVFQDQLHAGERLTSLPSGPVTAIFFLLIALALLSSLLASMRILGTDLSEALREGSA